jgi:hypothetical protein
VIPLGATEQFFETATHQNKTITVGDKVTVHHSGERRTVTVSSIVKRDNHFWVGFDRDRYYCPWPLVQMI